jgi:hypothetical protein
MRKLVVILVLLLSAFAAGNRSSTIPLPDSYYLDVDPLQCGKECLIDLINKGAIFSFLAKYDAAQTEDSVVNKQYLYYSSLLNSKKIVFKEASGSYYADNEPEADTKIALLYPSKVTADYAKGISSAVTSYLIARGIDFQFEIFDSVREDDIAIRTAIGNIKARGYDYIIAVVSQNALAAISDEADGGVRFFIPTLNAKDVLVANPNITFGGVDYMRQIEKLSYRANTKVASFAYNNSLGRKLSAYVNSSFPAVGLSETIARKANNFRSLIGSNKSFLKGSTVVLNAPVVESSLFMSQLRYYRTLPYTILTTQLLYNPDLFTMTQDKDIERLHIANSISKVDDKLDTISSLFGYDMKYNWILYAAAIGAERYLEDEGAVYNRLFDEQIVDNQIEYNVHVVKAANGRFIAVE